MSDPRGIVPTTSAAALLAIAGLVSGCTPAAQQSASTQPPTVASSVSATPSPSASPTPTPTFDAKQQAALAAVEGYIAVSNRIGKDPSKYSEAQMTKAFRRYTGGDMVKANVVYFLNLKKKNYHYAGAIVIKHLKASRVVDNRDSRGLETQVTACQDQTTLSVVTRSGQPAPDSTVPAFNLRQYSVRKPPGQSAWRTYGMSTVKGECGS